MTMEQEAKKLSNGVSPDRKGWQRKKGNIYGKSRTILQQKSIFNKEW